MRYSDTNDGIKIMPSETSIVPPEIKAIWEEADNMKISIIELKFFIDTSGRKKVISLYVNEFIIKDTRRTLKVLQISQVKTNYAVEYVMECCTVRGNVPKKEFSRFNIRDMNDIPILAAAVEESAILVTEDNVLRKDAMEYIESVTPEEALRKLGNLGKKRKGSGN